LAKYRVSDNVGGAKHFVNKAERRGLVTRLQSGLYTLVPFELSRETEYVGDPYVIAHELVRRRKYFVSHASAMELHRMVTQPQLSIFVSCPDQLRPRTIHDYE
jgi:predicted transcriptional regulator of viral defense system